MLKWIFKKYGFPFNLEATDYGLKKESDDIAVTDIVALILEII